MLEREELIELLSRYFQIGDSYAYNLTRVKTAFEVGTMSLEDFEEFDEETVADIADYLIEHSKERHTMTELEHLTKLIESAMYWGADTPEKIAERLIEESVICPPCKVGDTVYQTDGCRIYESTVRKIIYDTDGIAFDETAIGTSVFLACEEAEATLAERRKA